MFIILRIFICYSTWCDYFVIKRLLEVSECSEGLGLLEQFKSQINLTLSVTHLSLFAPNFLMIPSETSDFAVMTTQCVQEYSLLSLKYIREVKSLVTKIREINETACLFLATRDNPAVLFHRKNCLLTRYPIKRGTVPFKHPSRYIHGTRVIHAAVYRSHTDPEP